MKYLLVVFVTGLIVFSTACSSTEEAAPDLVGEWRVASIKDTLVGYNEVERERLLDWVNSLEWQFNADSTYHMTDSYDSVGTSGIYSYVAAKSKLEFKDSDIPGVALIEYGIQKVPDSNSKLIFHLPAPLASVLQVTIEKTPSN